MKSHFKAFREFGMLFMFELKIVEPIKTIEMPACISIVFCVVVSIIRQS